MIWRWRQNVQKGSSSVVGSDIVRVEFCGWKGVCRVRVCCEPVSR